MTNPTTPPLPILKKGEMQGYDWWFAHKDSKSAPAKKAAPKAAPKTKSKNK